MASHHPFHHQAHTSPPHIHVISPSHSSTTSTPTATRPSSLHSPYHSNQRPPTDGGPERFEMHDGYSRQRSQTIVHQPHKIRTRTSNPQPLVHGVKADVVRCKTPEKYAHTKTERLSSSEEYKINRLLEDIEETNGKGGQRPPEGFGSSILSPKHSDGYSVVNKKHSSNEKSHTDRSPSVHFKQEDDAHEYRSTSSHRHHRSHQVQPSHTQLPKGLHSTSYSFMDQDPERPFSRFHTSDDFESAYVSASAQVCSLFAMTGGVLFSGALTMVCLALAVSTDYWLYMSEPYT